MTSHAKVLSHKIMSGFDLVMEPPTVMGKMLVIVKIKPVFMFNILKSLRGSNFKSRHVTNNAIHQNENLAVK